MINFLPVPEWRHLLGALRRGVDPTDAQLAAPWMRAGDLVYWFSRSAWSLQVIAAWRQTFSPERPINFWVPDYFCNQSLVGVRATGVNLVFYPVNERLAPDWDRCRVAGAERAPHVFLLVHYFGQANDGPGAREFCNRHQAIFVEDCAHVLLPAGGMGTHGDFALYSPHKQLALPDGALLLARASMMRRVGGKPEEFGASFSSLLSGLNRNMPRQGKWVVRGLFVKHAPQFVAGWRRSRGGFEVKATDSPAAGGLSFLPAQSLLSRRLLARYLPEIEALGWERVENAAILEASTLGRDALAIVGPTVGAAFPHSFGVRYSDADTAEKSRQNARRIGYPAARWPDLAPEVLRDPARYSAAIRFFETTLFHPVHSTARAPRLLRRLREQRITPTVAGEFTVQWDVPVPEWRALFRVAPRSFLLQSSSYAEAMRRWRGWIPRHGAIASSGGLVATFTVLEKRGPLGLKAARLNRGPSWLDADMGDDAKRAAIDALAAHYPLRRGRALFCAPNLELTGPNLAAFATSRRWRRRIRPWNSVWLDLRAEEAELTQRLDGKWRNQLLAGQRKGLQLEFSDGPELMGWMLERHRELMVLRDFEGPAVEFIRLLAAALVEADEPMWVLRAMHEGQAVGGIAIARHGTSATYLLGWNGPEGRRLNAGNFLLWNATLRLKQDSRQWFDLGGLNQWQTPGITEFKRGMNGSEYRLLGEYLTFA